MSNESIEYSKYRLMRAKEDLESSISSLEGNFIKTSVNRSYYAIFHAMRAVLAIDEFDSKKHSGVIAYFIQHYIKTKVFDMEMSTIVNSASKIRNKCDYDDFYIVSKEQAEIQISQAKKFIEVIDKHLDNINN